MMPLSLWHSGNEVITNQMIDEPPEQTTQIDKKGPASGEALDGQTPDSGAAPNSEAAVNASMDKRINARQAWAEIRFA